MQLVVLSIHLIVCLCLVGLVLLQRSEGGALGMGGGGGSLVSGRGAADALAKMTSVAGAFFLVTSLSLTFLSGAAANASSRSVFDVIPRQERTAPVTAPAQPAPAPATTPDPTESSAPQASDTQVASLSQPPAPVTAGPIAPAATNAATRAAPLEARPQQAAVRAPTTTQTSAPRQTTTATQTPTRQTTTPTSTQTSRSTSTTPTRPLVLPNTSGGATGLTTPAPTEAESVEVGNGVEAVRRERAGPDQ